LTTSATSAGVTSLFEHLAPPRELVADQGAGDKPDRPAARPPMLPMVAPPPAPNPVPISPPFSRVVRGPEQPPVITTSKVAVAMYKPRLAIDTSLFGP
jgi:hypothetical protein